MDPNQLFDMESLGQAGLVLTVVSSAIQALSMLACYYLAARKGRSRVQGVLGGCLFGPFAVLHYYLLKPEQAGAPGGVQSQSQGRLMAKPARRLSEEEAIARMVDELHMTPTRQPGGSSDALPGTAGASPGAARAQPDQRLVPPPAPPPPPLPLVRKCWSCGAPYEPGASTCPACGIKLDY